nr:reverse transcriptase domain-containing protein [Tanacetum cinerariifolium]
INTFEQMAKMFLEKYFPPSMVTKLRNEITNFRQRPDESLFEAWERYKLSIDRCGTFMKRRPEECYDLIENMTAHHNDWDTLAQRITPSCETCAGLHSFNNCPATVGQTQNVYAAGAYQAYQAPGYQASVHQPSISQPQVVTTNEFTNFMKANDAILKIMQTNITSLKNSNLELKNMFDQFIKMNTASSLGLGTLPERKTEVTKDTVPLTNNGSTKDVQPPVVQTETPILNSEFVVAPIIEPVVAPDKLYELARTPLNEHCSAVLLKKFPEKLGDPAITFNLDQTSRYSANYKDMMANRINVIDMACEEYSQEVLGFSYVIASGNPTLYYDPIISTSSPTLTPFGDSDFLLEEVDAFLALEDDPTSPKVDHSYVDTEGDILLLEAFLNDDPSLPPSNQGNYLPQVRKELKICEAKTEKSLIDEPPEVELKDLPPHLEYAFLEGDDKLPIIIAKDLSDEEKTALITVLKSHKRAIAWKLSDIKDHFPLPFMDQMLERLAGNEYYYFLDGFLGYFQISIDPKDQEKTTFTCPYRTFTYRRMHFGLCNAPGTFQRCMMAIFHDMIKKTMEVFMDDFSVFGNSFQTCLSHLEKMLKWCEDTNLCLNWEKSHFMVKEGIVLGHKISKNEIKVDKSKVDVIAKLPHPTTVKGIRIFLGYAGFYRRFIQDFSKIARPMTRLLEKDTPFFFSKECVEAF